MDLTRSQLNRPDIFIDFVPIYWVPYIGSGEKIVALIATKPHINSIKNSPPKAYVVLPEKRLLSMMGTSRGISATAILKQSEEFINQRLLEGLDLEDALPPFEGFNVGGVRKGAGWALKQILEAAVRSVSVFGSTEDFFQEEVEEERHTATTREFLKRIQKSSFGKDVKDRFNKRLQPPMANAPEITIDYCHEKLLVQATSLPTTKRQELDLKREAVSKLYEIIGMQKNTAANWLPKLFLNVEVLDSATTGEAKNIALKAQEVIRFYANEQKVGLVIVHSTDDAIEKLELLG